VKRFLHAMTFANGIMSETCSDSEGRQLQKEKEKKRKEKKMGKEKKRKKKNKKLERELYFRCFMNACNHTPVKKTKITSVGIRCTDHERPYI
jgi:hypothetical protein